MVGIFFYIKCKCNFKRSSNIHKIPLCLTFWFLAKLKFQLRNITVFLFLIEPFFNGWLTLSGIFFLSCWQSLLMYCPDENIDSVMCLSYLQSGNRMKQIVVTLYSAICETQPLILWDKCFFVPRCYLLLSRITKHIIFVSACIWMKFWVLRDKKVDPSLPKLGGCCNSTHLVVVSTLLCFQVKTCSKDFQFFQCGWLYFILIP